jgi:hypothetical protein
LKIHVVVFWVVTPRSDVVGYYCFGVLCCFHPTISLHGFTTPKTTTWTAVSFHMYERFPNHKPHKMYIYVNNMRTAEITEVTNILNTWFMILIFMQYSIQLSVCFMRNL